MKGMLSIGKCFCFFEINTRSLPSENFNFLTEKLKPVEQWKVAHVTRVRCKYFAAFLSYLEVSFSVSF